MVELKVCLEFSDLEGLAEFSLENRLHTHHVARLHEYRDDLNRQQISNPSNFLRQTHLVISADFQNVVQQLWLLTVEEFVQHLFAQLNFLSAIVIISCDHEVSL